MAFNRQVSDLRYVRWAGSNVDDWALIIQIDQTMCRSAWENKKCVSSFDLGDGISAGEATDVTYRVDTERLIKTT